MSREAGKPSAVEGQGGEGSRRWTWGLAAGWLPAMGIGMTFSALADRLVFVGWGVLSAILYSWALRQGTADGRLVTWGLAASALALGALGILVNRHRESLDLGYRAFLPVAYHPWITHPGTSIGLGIASALGAASGWMKNRKRRTSR